MVNSRCFILMKNSVRPDSQLFNSWGCKSWGKGMGCSPRQPTRESWGSVVSSPSGVRDRAPAEKQVLKYLELEKTDLISLPPTFSIFPAFPWPLWNCLTFPGFPHEWSPCLQDLQKCQQLQMLGQHRDRHLIINYTQT